MKTTTAACIALGCLAATISASPFTVGGFSWDSDNAVTSSLFTEGGPGFIGVTTFPEPTKTIGNLLTGTSNSFVDITGTITNTARHTLTLGWGGAPNGPLLGNLPGHDLVIYETGSATAPEAYAISLRNAETLAFTSYYYFKSDSFDPAAQAFATLVDISDFGGSINFIDQIAIRAIFNSAGPNGGDRVDLAGGSGEGLVAFDVGAGNFLNRVLEPGPQGTPGEYAAARLDADIVYVVGLHNTAVPEPGTALLLTACIPAIAARRRRQARS